jgi:hypothetical protein
MVAKVKALRSGGDIGGDKATTEHSFESLTAWERIQSKLLSSPSRLPGSPTITVLRGQYPLTDALLDEAIMDLQSELDGFSFESVTHQHPYCPASNSLLHALSRDNHANLLSSSSASCSPSSSASSKHETKVADRGKPSARATQLHHDPKKKGDAIAIKYSKWQTDILMKWMIDNSASPFPETSDVVELTLATGLSHSQVVNWTTNVRKRNLKATCKGSKKPHHFIDFLFLKLDRESRKNPPVRASPPAAPWQPSKPQSLLPPVNAESDKGREYALQKRVGNASDLVAFADPVPDRLVASCGRISRPQTWTYEDDGYEPFDERQLLHQEEIGDLEPLDWKFDEREAHQPPQPHSELLEDFADLWEEDGDEDSMYLLAAKSSGHSTELPEDLDESLAPFTTHPLSFVTASSPVGRTAYHPSLLRSITFESNEYLPFATTTSNELFASAPTTMKDAPHYYYPKRQRPMSPPLLEYYATATDADECGPRGYLREENEDEYDWIKVWDVDDVKQPHL